MAESQQSIRELLAELEHKQWVEWANNLLPELQVLTSKHWPYNRWQEAGNCACSTCERIKRWQSLLKPYAELTEVQKDQDRIWADQILSILLNGITFKELIENK